MRQRPAKVETLTADNAKRGRFVRKCLSCKCLLKYVASAKPAWLVTHMGRVTADDVVERQTSAQLAH